MKTDRFIYKITPPAGDTVDSIHARIKPPAETLLASKYVRGVYAELEEDHLRLAIEVRSHDRWSNRKRARHFIVSVLTRAKLKVSDAELDEVYTPDTPLVPRMRDTDNRPSRGPDGEEIPRPEDTPDRLGCTACLSHEQRRYINKYGWSTGVGTYQGAGR